MILSFLIAIVTYAINYVFSVLPTATISDIPYIGSSVYAVLVNIMYTWNVIIGTFPYITAVYQIFVFVILPFEVATLVVRFILGNRTPVTH